MSIPSVRDRIVQAAAKIVLEPIFEADMADCSFGFGPERSPHDALQVLIDESWRGRRWVVETDIANCFEAIAHSGLMEAIEERVCDRAVLNLVRGMLRAGVMDGGSLRRSVTGAPQGGVISPLLCNVYLHRLDRAWSTGQHGVLVRFADDAVVMCRTRQQAKTALERLTGLLAGLGLESKSAEIRIVHLAEGEEGVDFLGFRHRLVRGWTPEVGASDLPCSLACARRRALGMGRQTAVVPEPDGPDQPRWNRDFVKTLPGLAREGRTPTVKNVGKPCAGEPHARFDGRGLETFPCGTAPVPGPRTSRSRSDRGPYTSAPPTASPARRPAGRSASRRPPRSHRRDTGTTPTRRRYQPKPLSKWHSRRLMGLPSARVSGLSTGAAREPTNKPKEP
ncbi:reverse transcriptase domain-containing protein [Actinomadura madurae]|nr:reverse transcriptase domain-containing protein [Actinomadura madurae]